jgi:hypothetical protein
MRLKIAKVALGVSWWMIRLSKWLVPDNRTETEKLVDYIEESSDGLELVHRN